MLEFCSLVDNSKSTIRYEIFLTILMIAKQVKLEGTSPFLKEIVTGRCFDYQETYNPEPFLERYDIIIMSMGRGTSSFFNPISTIGDVSIPYCISGRGYKIGLQPFRYALSALSLCATCHGASDMFMQCLSTCKI